ncbi:hypothetical protein [Weissella confusa]|nr:hypothetical protein [Weissella confusa]TGE63268.1 hypothetical protein C6P17_10890 [Weissella confusa]
MEKTNKLRFVVVFLTYVVLTYVVSMMTIAHSNISAGSNGNLIATIIATIISVIGLFLTSYVFKVLMQVVTRFVFKDNYRIPYMELVTAYGFIQVINAIINLFSLWIIGKPYNQVNVILAIVLSVVISILFGVVIKNSNQIKVKNSVVVFIALVNMILLVIPIFK